MRWKVPSDCVPFQLLVTHSRCLQVLVYDDAGEHAVCTLFKIAQLRAQGVTVFYNLNGTRERGPVPDAPAVCAALTTQTRMLPLILTQLHHCTNGGISRRRAQRHAA